MLNRLQAARNLIDTSWHLPLNLEQISQYAGFSRHHFLRAFRRTFGITPHQYLTWRRIEKAQYLLAYSDMSVTDICCEVGFQSLGSFSALFRRYTGCSPLTHRTRMTAKKRQLHRAVPSCYIVMLGLDETLSYTTDQFSRSNEESSQV